MSCDHDRQCTHPFRADREIIRASRSFAYCAGCAGRRPDRCAGCPFVRALRVPQHRSRHGLALTIDPAPQGSIALDQVPLELKSLVQALNRSFDEIDAYIRMHRWFLGNTAHQLRTPLTVLRAKIEDVAEPAIRAELVRDVRRLASLVSAMLDLTRLQNHAIEKQPFDLAIVTRDVLADLGPSALDAGIELSLEADKGIAIIQGVEAAIRSARANLVGNALIHARGARHIVARLDAGSVSITDDGAGIYPDVRDKLLEPFQTGNCANDSAGLGLSIVQEIMAAHGGE
jgi:signal transduction histidine kinase